MTDQPIPRIGAKAKCRHCGEQIIYEPWFRDGRGPNPPVWAHAKGPRTCDTRPKGWRKDKWPFAEPACEPEAACAHCGDTGHTWDDCQAYTRVVAFDEAPAPADLREQYAAAIALYDHAVGQATDPAPRDHHYGQADAVLAVRDRELEQLRAQLGRVRAECDRLRASAVLADGEPHTDRERGIVAAVTRVLAALDPQERTAGHQYLSTGCLHDRHDYCQSMTGLAGAKRPAECKFCQAACICPCHTQPPSA